MYQESLQSMTVFFTVLAQWMQSPWGSRQNAGFSRRSGYRLPSPVFIPFIFAALFCTPVQADVVKPALVEINAYTSGKVEVEIRASVEALLTGINSRYKNTQEAPTADEYDELRKLQGPELTERFTSFHEKMLSSIELAADGKKVPLHIEKVDIPEPGYTKVPRNSLIVLSGDMDRATHAITWYYPQAFGDNAVRVRQIDKENEKWVWSDWQWIRKDEPSEPFSLEEVFTQKPVYEVVLSYISIGFDHIIPMGTDHILFILGIFLFSRHWRPLLAQVTMFTVAHTITLGLSMNGVISLPSSIVEPLIALSIAYVGLENVYANAAHKTRLPRSRLALVFGFGLLHGMGFAGALKDFGMPDEAFMTALISFNVGVELGQLAVIAIAYFGVAIWFRKSEYYRKFVVIPVSLMISAVALYWTVERLNWLG